METPCVRAKRLRLEFPQTLQKGSDKLTRLVAVTMSVCALQKLPAGFRAVVLSKIFCNSLERQDKSLFHLG